MSRAKLHDYQEKAVRFILDKRRVALFLFMGGGKSLISLTAISDLLDSFTASKVLIIAPLRVANSVWLQEARKWEHTRHLDIRVATGSERQRLKALQYDSDVVIINRENIPWITKLYAKKWPFDTVFIDESSSLKSASTQRFKAMKRILPETRNMVLLTGTPSPNGHLDLWSQIYLLDYGKALGRTMSAYKSRFFDADFMGYRFTPKEGAAEEIQDLIRPMTLSMCAEDYLDLPDRIDLIEPVTLPPQAMKSYNDFERELFIELDGDEVEASTAAVLANRLLQVSNGALYTDSHGNWKEIHSAKLDALEAIVEDNPGENILVAYNYKSDLERLQTRFGKNAVVLDKNPDTIDRWNRGEIPMLLAHPQSASMGLNLQAGGSLIVWFSLCWSLEYYQQFNARLHRQGQSLPVRIVHLVSQGTIDERVVRVLGEKDSTQASLLASLR
jgi:SNF2 family DNA or RNA helicase